MPPPTIVPRKKLLFSSLTGLDQLSGDQVTTIGRERASRTSKLKQRLVFTMPHNPLTDANASGTLPTVLDLVFIVKAVHHHSTTYDVLTNQCYCFASTLLRVFEASSDIWQGLNHIASNSHWRIEEVEEASGKWIGISIHTPNFTAMAEVGTISSNFRTEKLEANTQVSSYFVSSSFY